MTKQVKSPLRSLLARIYMHKPEQLFQPLSVNPQQLPKAFTFPFYYQPHPFCVEAAQQLQQQLTNNVQWQHDFGLDDSHAGTGKMFGVLLVRSPQGDIGYFSAFSGKIADQNLHAGFVPPVFDMLAEECFFRAELDEITQLNHQVSTLSANPKKAQLSEQLKQSKTEYKNLEQSLRQQLIENRAARKSERESAQSTFSGDQLKNVLDQLAKQSVADKNRLKYLKLEWDEKIATLETQLNTINHEITNAKQQRKTLSNRLQNKLFEQYCFLNANGQNKSLKAIFAQTSTPTPPAGAGECAAPKLLHYAYLHGYQPLALAEFWWGSSPKSEIRQHKQFYPSCHSKCQPILGHMLQGLDVDPNPLEDNWGENKPLEIIYQDEAIVVVNKPSGLLSVPGKTIKDSAYTRLQTLFPDVEGPFVLHRLDMATSGLLVFALTRRANKHLQKQFITRQVQKRYVALIDGIVTEQQGTIDLPMRGDPDDRPRQLVCYEHGKPAHTDWELIQVVDGKSKLHMYPRTGRTHQLRVHCAHHLGLNIPMVGDGLYGEKSNRLHLHAEQLEFDHPYSKKHLKFHADVEF